MPHQRDDPVAQAAFLARDVAPDLSLVLLTHYPDAETLDTIRPGETDLAMVRAINRAVALEMLDAGVEVLVQRADRAAFRRWLADRDDTLANRLGWIDRARLLRGPAALQMLGIPDAAAPPPLHPQAGHTAPGPIADRLLQAYGDEHSAEFDGLVQDLMAAGRTDVLDLAVRKLGETDGDDAAEELDWVFLVAAEGAAIGPSGWAEMVAMPVALSPGDLPDGEALGEGLRQSGAVLDSEELRLLPGWRSPDALASLSFGAVRRVLLEMVDGKPPRDLPPGDTDDLARSGFGILVGLRLDWDIPIWDAMAHAGGLPEEPGEDQTPDEAARAAAYERWRARVFQDSEGCVPLGLVPLSQVANEIADFLAEAGEQTSVLEDIRSFITACRDRAAGSDIVCETTITADTLELAISTSSGRYLDSLSLPTERLPLPAQDMPNLIDPLLSASRA